MDFEVRFRFNKLTGEVEVFDVDDLGSGLTMDEHNRLHDQSADEIGRVITPSPIVTELAPRSRADDQRHQNEGDEEHGEAHPEGETE